MAKKEGSFVWIYMETAKHRHDICGHRFFRYSTQSDTIVQVTKTSGESKRGRGNTYGISLISRMTLFANYVALGYATPITKRVFEKAFDEVVNNLR